MVKNIYLEFVEAAKAVILEKLNFGNEEVAKNIFYSRVIRVLCTIDDDFNKYLDGIITDFIIESDAKENTKFVKKGVETCYGEILLYGNFFNEEPIINVYMRFED